MKYGNTSAASIPILLSECVEEGFIHLDGSQKIILQPSFGGGLTWGTLIVTIQVSCGKHIVIKFYFKGVYHGVFEKLQEIIVEELGKDASEVTLEPSF